MACKQVEPSDSERIPSSTWYCKWSTRIPLLDILPWWPGIHLNNIISSASPAHDSSNIDLPWIARFAYLYILNNNQGCWIKRASHCWTKPFQAELVNTQHSFVQSSHAHTPGELVQPCARAGPEMCWGRLDTLAWTLLPTTRGKPHRVRKIITVLGRPRLPLRNKHISPSRSSPCWMEWWLSNHGIVCKKKTCTLLSQRYQLLRLQKRAGLQNCTSIFASKNSQVNHKHNYTWTTTSANTDANANVRIW